MQIFLNTKLMIIIDQCFLLKIYPVLYFSSLSINCRCNPYIMSMRNKNVYMFLTSILFHALKRLIFTAKLINCMQFIVSYGQTNGLHEQEQKLIGVISILIVPICYAFGIYNNNPIKIRWVVIISNQILLFQRY